MHRELLKWCRKNFSGRIREAHPATVDFLMGVCPVFTLTLERNLPDHMGSVLAIVFEYLDDLKYSDAQREQYYKHGYYYGIHYAWNEQLSRKVYRSKDDIFCRWCFHSENHREIRQGFDIKDVREDGERQRFEERRKRSFNRRA